MPARVTRLKSESNRSSNGERVVPVAEEQICFFLNYLPVCRGACRRTDWSLPLGCDGFLSAWLSGLQYSTRSDNQDLMLTADLQDKLGEVWRLVFMMWCTLGGCFVPLKNKKSPPMLSLLPKYMWMDFFLLVRHEPFYRKGADVTGRSDSVVYAPQCSK